MEHRNFHLPTLDGWRAVAITLVLLDHAGDSLLLFALPLFGRSVDDLAGYRYIKEALGRAGVHLFFGLSGYLITARLMVEEARGHRVDLIGFYRRRILRIQPAALCYLAVVGLAGLAGVLDVNAGGWISALFSYANFSAHQTWYTGHFWSLSVEEHFYLLWPAAFAFALLRLRLRIALVTAVVLTTWRFVAWKFQWTTGPTFFTRTDIESEWLIWGCIGALLTEGKQQSRIISTAAETVFHLIAIPLMVIPVAFSLGWKTNHLLVTLAAVTVPLLFIGTVRRPDRPLGQLLRLAPVAWLGRISFSLYLWQQAFVVWDASRSPAFGMMQRVPFNLVAALLAACCSYYLIEQPVIRWGRAREKRWQALVDDRPKIGKETPSVSP